MSDDVMKGFDAADSGAAADPSDLLARAGLPHNDVGNARRLLAAFGPDLLYVLGRGWGGWDGRRFDFEAGELMATALAARLQDLVEAEAAALSRQPIPAEQVSSYAAANGLSDDEAEKKLRASRRSGKMKWAVACGNTSRITGALKQLAPMLRRRADELDARPYRVTALNGVIDLELAAAERPEAEEPEERLARAQTWLKPFAREDLGTRVLGCAYDPAAACPKWLDFLSIALPDAEMRDFLRRCMGYLLAGRNAAQVAMLLIGQGGNGKSTVAMAVQTVLADFAMPCRIDLFMASKQSNAGAASPEEAVLPGARAYMASEPEIGAELSSSKIKGFTGGEPRQSRGLGKEPFIWRPNGVPLISLNRMPRVSDESHGLWRRLVFIEFLVDLTKLDTVKNFHEVEADLREEAAGILNWMLEGWADYRARRSLAPPASAMAKSAEMRAAIDPVGEFLAECVETVLGHRIQSSDLHKVFEKWCAAAGTEPLAIRRFKKLMIDKGHHSIKSGGKHFWVGLAWSTEPHVGELLREASAGPAAGDDWGG